MEANAGVDPDYFVSLEAMAAGLGVAVVLTDLGVAALSVLPSGRPVVFIPRSASPEMAGTMLAAHVKNILSKPEAA